MEFRVRRKKKSIKNEKIIIKKKKEDTFVIGEKILCYEPDEKLQKVLYDAKISDIYESHKRGSNKYEYLVHFLGWNSSWDRKVSEDHLLKDTPDNRELQLKLAEKSSLQLGAYLYRKEQRKKRMKKRLLLDQSDVERKQDINELESNSSATESSHDDDRVFLHIGEILKSHLEYDYKMICTKNLLPKFGANIPSVVSIFESFVKFYALKILTIALPKQEQPKRRNSINVLSRKENRSKTIDYAEIINDINLCKETVDGLRIYFNFILKDFLLYPEEKNNFEKIMSNFKTSTETNNDKNDYHFSIEDYFLLNFNKQQKVNENTQDTNFGNNSNTSKMKTDDERVEKENISSLGSTSSCESIISQIEINRKGFYSKLFFPPISSFISSESKKIIKDTFKWKMLSDRNNEDNNLEPALVFGVYYLLRLIVKLPEFLTVSLLNDPKMAVLLKYLDEFVEFLEENVELYGDQNYYI